jgi:hypothetical protein
MKTDQTIARYRVEGLVAARAMGEVSHAYEPGSIARSRSSSFGPN